MNKKEFLDSLRDGLSGFPEDDIEERVSYYGEIIDDMTDEGMTEEEAVSKIESVEEIVSQITEESPLYKIVKGKIKTKEKSKARIALIIIGSPLWSPLLVAVFAVLLAVYISLWAVIISLWAVELSLIVGAAASIIIGIINISRGFNAQGIAFISVGLVLAGLSVFAFLLFRAITIGFLLLTKKTIISIKKLILGRGKQK